MKISLKCDCGALRGVVESPPHSRGMRTICLCDDCQAYAHFLRRADDVLDANGGTDIYAIHPANLQLTRGVENLRCLRLSPKGPIRWYAGCCKTPIANTAPNARMPFNGVVHNVMDHAGDATTRDHAIGPVEFRIFGKYAKGKPPTGTLEKGSARLLLRAVAFMAKGFFRRAYRPSPFFDAETGEPTVEPYVLSREERDTLRPLCGPKGL